MSLSDWVVSNRPTLTRPEPGTQVLGWQDEWEPSDPHGNPVPVRTLFLRGSECRFRCTMCDLWQYTHQQATQPGNLVAQVRSAVQSLPADSAIRWWKLYNASNFFDPFNVPVADLPEIADLLRPFQRVIVENHPRIVPWKVIDSFAERLAPAQLEIAVGLETIQPESLLQLNKQFTLAQCERALEEYRRRGIDVRAFALLGLPGMSLSESLNWCQRTVDWALQRGVRHVSVIPMRSHLGITQQWLSEGQLIAPRASQLEQLLTDNLGRRDGVVTVDLWDWEQLCDTCSHCRLVRLERMEQMNLHRAFQPAYACEVCHANC